MIIKDIDIGRGAESPGVVEIEPASAITFEDWISENIINSNSPRDGRFHRL